MADLMQQAREFLTAAWIEAGWPPEAAAVLASGNDTQITVQLSAIAAALRAAPEVPDGFVMVQVRDARALYQHALTTPHNMAILAAHRVRDQIAARPQGVKDV